MGPAPVTVPVLVPLVVERPAQFPVVANVQLVPGVALARSAVGEDRRRCGVGGAAGEVQAWVTFTRNVTGLVPPLVTIEPTWR